MAAMKATSSPHTSPTSGSSELKGVRILLVEDSWHVGKAMKRCFEHWERRWPGRPRPEPRLSVWLPSAGPGHGHRRHQSAGRRAWPTDLIDRLHGTKHSGHRHHRLHGGFSYHRKGRGHPAETRQQGTLLLAVLRPIVARRRIDEVVLSRRS